MYDLAEVVPEADVAPGTNLLISGPPMTGKRRIAFEILGSGTNQGEGTIVVTTKDSARKVLSEYEGYVSDPDTADVGIVDCVTKQQGGSNVEDDRRVKFASSPVDMTGIGIKLSEFLEEFYEVRGHQRNRILLHSVSTLLMYSDLQTVFRFLHVFTGRIQSADALGLYVIDSTAHDEQTMNTLKQLFDGIITVEEGDDDEPIVSSMGISTTAD
jgi:KaiC/GvpD/RAD55 family RecA-like ATPase